MLAWNRGKLIAQYAANPLIVRAEGNELTAALSLDTMTDPNYRGRGVFWETSISLYNEMEKNKFFFIYGFPNSKSIGGF